MLGRLFSLLNGGGSNQPGLDFGAFRLRAPLLADFPEWASLRAASRGFLQPFEPSWPEDDLTPQGYQRRLRMIFEEARLDMGYTFFITARADNKVLGGVSLSHLRRRAAQSASLGYWMGQRHAGRGIMSAAVPALCRHAFADLHLERVEAACLPENAASIRVLEKSGFRLEGHARSYLSINGQRRDHRLFALLPGDLSPAR
jgi:[ribosomal protein S5]-alanine N-acetyltransferase